MDTFLALLSFLALLCSLTFFIIFIIRAVKKQRKRQSGIIALISFVISLTVAIIGSHLYPVENKETRIKQNAPNEDKTIILPKNEESEMLISPKNGRKLKIMGNNLTFRIGTISQDSLGIKIPLYASESIPLLDGAKAPVKMKIVIDKQIMGSSNINLSGIMQNVVLSETIKGGKLLGHIDYVFPTTKIPNEIIVYNSDNKSIKFKVKIKK